MKIIWTPNPLSTVVELDEHDLSLLWHRLKIERLEERIGQARFDLNQEDREWHNKNIKERTLDEAVASALKQLDVDNVEEGLAADMTDCAKELSAKHSGDCTCVPCSCLKCHAETLMGVETITGLGKHEASYIDGAFADGRTIAEALGYLMDYRPTKGKGWEQFMDEEFQVHVPRWIEEAKRAHAWLETYRETHSL
jgi:hypothetical protein